MQQTQIQPFWERPHANWGGVQKLYAFEGTPYGASVVRTPGYDPSKGKYMGSYGGEQGLWELAVVKFAPYPPRIDGEWPDYELNTATSVTSDVIGRLTDDGLQEILREIAALGS